MDRNGTSNEHNMNIPVFPSFSIVESLHNCFKKITLSVLSTYFVRQLQSEWAVSAQKTITLQL